MAECANWRKTSSGRNNGPSRSAERVEVLNILAEKHEIPKHILSIRQKSKIKNTYLDKILPQLDKDGRLRTGFNIHSTTSGRLSSSGKMNMQQIPRDNPIVKGCIKAKPGNKIVAMDLTTAEVYVAAVLSEDENLMNIFREGGNFHSSIAKLVYNLDCPVDNIVDYYPTERQAAKAVTFGIMYGAGAKKISEQVTKDSGKYFSKIEAQAVIDDYFNQFSKLRLWIDRSSNFIRDNGFIYSHFGRKRRLPNVKSDNRGIASHEVRSGLNFLVQSIASDINLSLFISGTTNLFSWGKKSHLQESFSGVSLSGFISTAREFQGISIAPVNYTSNVHRGFQIGLINYSEKLHGIQIGIINIAKNSSLFPYFPLINFSTN